MPSDSLHDENYYANDYYRSDDPVSEHFVSSQWNCAAVIIGHEARWDNNISELACAWPLNDNQLGESTA